MKKIIFIIALLAIVTVGSGCTMNMAQKGAGLGALSGALLGSLVSGDKEIGAAVGALVGGAAGYMIGNEWDKYDAAQVSSIAETVPSGRTVGWQNPDTGRSYQATPQPAYTQNQRVYREVVIKEDGPDGRPIYATVYRGDDGNWHLVQGGDNNG
ncbi:glycine zipper domain-containing protein [Pseudodesulfovibrio pelocollis]|uniref:glycine zipper domain-containing protein n=1 Tax=Pseudodesulfovibrio pelocollis TaxID=3051432 RepID=UPI00255AEFF2|nr:glycine zipper domain-containing protein [Pseudodesulfovibrio sp. SB368]